MGTGALAAAGLGQVLVAEVTVSPAAEPPMLAYNGTDVPINRKGCNIDNTC